MQFPIKYLQIFRPFFFIIPTHLTFLFTNIRYRVKQTRNGETDFEDLVKNTILSNHFSGLRACMPKCVLVYVGWIHLICLEVNSMQMLILAHTIMAYQNKRLTIHKSPLNKTSMSTEHTCT